MPVFHFHDCDNPCCETGQDTCCTIEVMDECTMSNGECNTQVFIPVLSAPISQYESMVDMFNGNIVRVPLLSLSVENLIVSVDEIVHPPEPPPSFLTPLLA